VNAVVKNKPPSTGTVDAGIEHKSAG